MLMPSVASASNMSAATPGCDFIPAPTSESFAMSSSIVNRSAPTSAVSDSSADRSRWRSARGAVNDRSVVSSCDTFCTIMSTLTPSAAIALKTRAATPGRSGTSSIVTFASSASSAIPLISTPSISSSLLSRTQVPAASSNADRTWILTPWRRAISTDRVCNTFAPPAASSSISSYPIASTFRAPGTIRGSAVNTPSTSV